MTIEKANEELLNFEKIFKKWNTKITEDIQIIIIQEEMDKRMEISKKLFGIEEGDDRPCY